MKRLPAAVAAALVAAVAGLILTLALGEDDPSPANRADRGDRQAHVGAPTGDRDRGNGPRPILALPDRGHPIVWVRTGERVALRAAPGSDDVVREVDARTEFRSRTTFSVVRSRGPWAGVTTHFAANGELLWLRLNPRRLRSAWTPYAIDVDLSARRAELRRGDRALRTFAVTVGAPGTPTPVGRFAVTDTFRGDLNPAYGCCALAISAEQPHLPSGWMGGSRIAIHGTYGELGVAGSSGCVRASDADLKALMRRLPLGTPVVVRQ